MRRHFLEILESRLNLPEKTLEEIRKIADKPQDDVHSILLKKNLVSEHQLLKALSLLYDMPFMAQLSDYNPSAEFTQLVPIQFLKKNCMVPLMTVAQKAGESGGTEPVSSAGDGHSACMIAVNDPANFQPMDDLIRILEIPDFQVVLAPKDTILSVINQSYDKSRGSAQQLVEDMEENGTEIINEIEKTADLLDDTSDAPIIKLVNHIISQSIKARASDIHIEPFQDTFKVRYRVDGILYDLLTPPKWIQSSLISRIKVMAKLNIAEKRLPQDGRIEVKIGKQDIDIRVSTIPTTFGERVVLRLLNKSESLLKLSEFGIAQERLHQIHRLIHMPNGIILVTGPTGSGKTTTLYAILSEINSPEINIITVEDPVEYQLDGIGQIQVNRKIDLTFARGLRSIVRQDPDVILIGEIRDRETAEIAVQSALTGHLVFSTLHTNDSASAITRLVDIGIESFLLSSALKAIIAQRLVRVLCDQCKEAYTPDMAELRVLAISPEKAQGKLFYRPKGCPACFHTGYRGRICIMEIMVIDDKLKSMILQTSDANRIRTLAMEQNMISLRRDGIEKIFQGITSIEEVIRITHL